MKMSSGTLNSAVPSTTDTIVTSDLSGHTTVLKANGVSSVSSISSSNAVEPASQPNSTPIIEIEEGRSVYQIPPSRHETDQSADPTSLIDTLKKKRVFEKFVYVTSVLTLVFLSHAILSAQWLLPYYYAISAPVLILIRVVLYCKLKWQYFLLDFCYTANTLWYIFLWAVPANGVMFSIIFSLSNGPVLWATILFRNSLVLHSLDKVTSSFIHILPPFLSFVVRWYTPTTSLYWYTPFIPSIEEPSFIWLVAVPLACFVAHSLIYTIVVEVILKPSDEFLTSYRYLTSREGSCINRVYRAIKPSWRLYVYNLVNWLFCLSTLLITRLLYEYFVAHCVILVVVVLILVFNGASFYVDVFSERGFQEEE